MKRRRKSDCPVHVALNAFGDPWTLLIVRDLMFKGKSRYNEFLDSEEGIATNILADRLASLEREGIVTKEPVAAGRQRARYRLTPKGVDLLPVMAEMIAWSARHDRRTAADRSFVARLRRDREGFLAQLRADLRPKG